MKKKKKKQSKHGYIYILGISVAFNGQQLGMSLDFTDFAPKKSDHFSGVHVELGLAIDSSVDKACRGNPPMN